MIDRFDICHPITAKWEGGWSDHKADPGGKTMYGITEAVYHAWLKAKGLALKPVRNITMAEALAIYRAQYWVKCGAPDLFPGVDLATYDASVNSGISRGRKWLVGAAGSNDHSETVKRICRARLSFMQSLKIWQSFGKGWGRRVADIEAKGVAMALEAMGLSQSQVKEKAKAEATTAQKQSSNAGKAATSAAAGSSAAGGAPVVDPTAVTDPTALWLLGAVCVVGVVATVIFIAKKRAADSRAAAYAEVTA